MIVIRVLVFVVGFWLVVYTMISAIRTFVLARAARDRITATVFRSVRLTINFGLRFTKTYEQRDKLMAFYAPLGSLMLLPAWLFLVSVGYAAMNWSTGIDSWIEAYTISGSSLLTLGFARSNDFIHTLLAFSEATIGLILVALLIAYLPTMYSAFSRRELAVTLLEVRAGSPHSPVEILARQHRIGAHERLNELWREWNTWFADIEESHTTLATLVFFRSPDPRHSWITASGVVLDAAALAISVVDAKYDPETALCLRSGYLALNRISRYFGISCEVEPTFPRVPISISRREFDEACDYLAAEGVPLQEDRDQAWLTFAGWRVNYDRPLLALCALTMAPKTMWSADRIKFWDIHELQGDALDRFYASRSDSSGPDETTQSG